MHFLPHTLHDFVEYLREKNYESTIIPFYSNDTLIMNILAAFFFFFFFFLRFKNGFQLFQKLQ